MNFRPFGAFVLSVNTSASISRTMKKISRKDIAGMSTMEFLKAGAGPYRQLAGYLKPYKARFCLGIFFGALYGLMNGGMVLTIKFVGEKVFGTKDSSKEFEKLVDKLPEGDVAEEGGAFNAVREVFKNYRAVCPGELFDIRFLAFFARLSPFLLPFSRTWANLHLSPRLQLPF